MIIRSMQPGDTERLAQMEIECFKEPWSENAFITELSNPAARYVVAVEENKIVGYGGMWIILDEGHINNIAVSRDYRRRGIGLCVMETLMEIALNEGATSMTLEVRRSNAPAIALYEQLGFKKAGVRKKYYGDEDAIIMWNNRLAAYCSD